MLLQTEPVPETELPLFLTCSAPKRLHTSLQPCNLMWLHSQNTAISNQKAFPAMQSTTSQGCDTPQHNILRLYQERILSGYSGLTNA